ncbi:MAG: hypothetical protein ACFFEM_02300 [Candidatus Thorarchaeota archaeon]
MGYWRFDCVIVLLILLGCLLIVIGSLFAFQIELIFLLVYLGLGFLLLGIAVALAWHPEDSH